MRRFLALALFLPALAYAAETITNATLSNCTIGSGTSTGTPELPRLNVDTSMPTQTGATTTTSCANLQSDVNAAALGDTIVVPVASTCTGQLTLPNKTSGTGWIVIKSSATASLPPEGTRVAVADASNMPKLQAASPNLDVVNTANTAHHYRFIGIEIRPTPSSAPPTSALVNLGSGIDVSTSTLPHHIVFDRCYIHGDATNGVKRGIGVNGDNIGVVDSYISDIKLAGFETQAVGYWLSNGPLKFQNNYLEAASINSLSGGTSISIANLITRDVTYKNNFFKKNPAWQGAGLNLKNLFEIKNGQRWLIDSNRFENSWADGQTGVAIVFSPQKQSCFTSWVRVDDITFTNNYIKNAAEGMRITGTATDCPSAGPALSRVLVQNNLFDTISGPTFGVGDTYLWFVLSASDYVKIAHNTSVNQNDSLVSLDGSPSTGPVIFSDNLVFHGNYGLFRSGSSVGDASITAAWGTTPLSKDVFIGPYPTGGGATSSNYTGHPGTCPTTCFPNGTSDVGFVNYAGGNYRLTTGSVYHNAATDGTDIGANIDNVYNGN